MSYYYNEIRTSNDINFLKSMARHEFFTYRVEAVLNPNITEEIQLIYRASNFVAHTTYTPLPLR